MITTAPVATCCQNAGHAQVDEAGLEHANHQHADDRAAHAADAAEHGGAADDDRCDRPQLIALPAVHVREIETGGLHDGRQRRP